MNNYSILFFNNTKNLKKQTFESKRPVDKVKIKVLQLQISQGLLQGGFNEIRSVFCVPEFARDEEIFALNDTLIYDGGQTFTDRLLVAVNRSCVDVTVSDANCIFNSFDYRVIFGL